MEDTLGPSRVLNEMGYWTPVPVGVPNFCPLVPRLFTPPADSSVSVLSHSTLTLGRTTEASSDCGPFLRLESFPWGWTMSALSTRRPPLTVVGTHRLGLKLGLGHLTLVPEIPLSRSNGRPRSSPMPGLEPETY